ncbi:HNH endonuclease signature motif containing protein [Roseivirga seohaensis]|uniref:HNH endonuclease signature motif containing protein n=1 Tax=Roseivirga seohaensis TaxID=1914963 RepID=UPI003BA89151
MENKDKYIILPDLDKKIEEAFHDAVNYFQKKCPYCDTPLFSGHIRSKIHLDHFEPINKGGQHVPWNILPVCQKCNSRKSDKSPDTILLENRYLFCKKYLDTVRDKYVGQIQIDLENYEQLKSLIINALEKNEAILPTYKKIVNIITGRYSNDNEYVKYEFDINEKIEKAIREKFKLPVSGTQVLKLSASEILIQIQPLLSHPVTRNQIGKKLKEMGFLQRLERINSEVKRVYYLAPN